MKKLITLFMLLCMVCTGAWADPTLKTGLGQKVYRIYAHWEGNSTNLPMVINNTAVKTGASSSAEASLFVVLDSPDGYYYIYDVNSNAFSNDKNVSESNTAKANAFYTTDRNGCYTWVVFDNTSYSQSNNGLSLAVKTTNQALDQYTKAKGQRQDNGSVTYNGNTYTTDFILEEASGYTLYKVVALDGGSVTTSLTTKAQYDGGYVVVSGEATASSFTCSEGITVKSIDEVNKTVTTQGNSYTLESGTKTYTEIVSEFGGTPTLIRVKSGATLDIDAAYDCSNVAAEDGSTVIISTTNTDIATITGNVNVVININYSFVGNKTTRATGKLVVNTGKQLNIGGGQAQTNSLESFTSVQVYGTLYNNNKNTVLKNVTFEDGSVLHSYDMDAPGNNAANGTYSNALRLTGTTVINGTVNSTSYYNAQYSIDKLAGEGTLKIRGKSASEFATMNNEAAYYTISNTSEFTGKLDIKNTDARITPIENVTILNNLFVKTATLTNITITGNTRIEAAGDITINGPVANNLSNNTYGYAFVGNNSGSAIKLGGTIDLTKNGSNTNNSNNKIGYNSGMNVRILAGSDVLAGGVYNSAATLANNADVTIEGNAILAVTGNLYTPNLTNNGTIKLLNLNSTRYTATTVSGETFNVQVAEELLTGMSGETYNIISGVTTNNVANFTLNGEEEVVIGENHFRVIQSGAYIVLTKAQMTDYTITYRTGNNHSWQINDRGITNSTLSIDNFNDVEFYNEFAFEETDLQLRADNNNFTITCTEAFPFAVGELCRFHAQHADAGRATKFFAGETYPLWEKGSSVAPANTDLWFFEHVAGTANHFTVRNYSNGKYLTMPNTNRAMCTFEATPVSDDSKTSVMAVRRSTYGSAGNQNFVLQTIKDNAYFCVGPHMDGGDSSDPVTNGVATWGPSVDDAAGNKNNCLEILPIETFTATLNGMTDDGYYGTIYMPYDMTLEDNGAKAYKAVAHTDGKLHLQKVEGTIPAGGYVLYKKDESASGRMTVKATMENNITEDNENILTGSIIVNQPFATSYNYVLNNGSYGVGFYKYTPTAYPTAKAVLCAESSAQVSAFVFDFGGDSLLTAIQEFQRENQENGTIFDLQGRRIQKIQKGMNIINGRKVLR